jgi:hypothetical protein
MKWYDNKPTQGQKRKKTKFLFLPKKLKGETRWLEFATIWQVGTLCSYTVDGYLNQRLCWKDVGWADPD